MKTLISVLIVMCLFSFVYAAEPPKIIKLKDVVFDHEGHKGDCISCHDSLEGNNKINGFGKDVAHEKCVGCHKGLGSGPTGCKECHKQ